MIPYLETVKPNDVITIKMRGSEELIAKAVGLEPANVAVPDYIVVKQPLQILPSGQGQIGTMPYVITVDPDMELRIPLDYVVVAVPAIDAIRNMYIQRTTGLDMSAAGTSSIITG